MPPLPSWNRGRSTDHCWSSSSTSLSAISPPSLLGFHAEAEAESTRPSSPAKENLRRDGVEVRGGLEEEEEEESEVDVDDDGDDEEEEEMPKGAVATDRFLKGAPVITRLCKRRTFIENRVHT